MRGGPATSFDKMDPKTNRNEVIYESLRGTALWERAVPDARLNVLLYTALNHHSICNYRPPTHNLRHDYHCSRVCEPHCGIRLR